MNYPRIVTLCLLTLAVVVPALAQDEPPAATLDSIALGEGLHFVRTDSRVGNPSTVVAEGDGGFFVVDPNLLIAGDVLKQFLADHGGGPVRFIATTHYHGDHTEGLQTFPAAVAIAPREQRRRLATGSEEVGEAPGDLATLPALAIDGNLSLHFGSRTIDLLLPPERNGHTDGDLLVYFREDGVLCAGDYVFYDRFPVIDLDNGGSLEGYLGNLRWIVSSFPPDTRIVPGHGTFAPAEIHLVTIADLRAWIADLEMSVEWIRTKLESGASAESLAQADDLPVRMTELATRPRYMSVPRWIALVQRGLVAIRPASSP